MLYTLLADAIVAVHLAYVAFVVVGELLIVAGLVLRWGWVSNPWFRSLHLLAIAIVALESVGDVKCPLTEWEDQLRIAASRPAVATLAASSVGLLAAPLGQGPDLATCGVFPGRIDEVKGTFIGRMLHDVFILDDVPYDHWGFTVAYVGFAVLVIVTFVLAPPRRRALRPGGEAASFGGLALEPHPRMSAAARSESPKP